ncbi:hypothetical protein COCVIDRAFT_33169 [Bipolaris victoriae FI3]|uniref:Uncharacterized protein n=2 Tax=Bipolaris TaxID=33194 RepID=W6YG36_COCC2|nr:uncharacterized protein COCCADRAFT_82965 [Bipolaris zeicola 26-R-13]XP_014561935.1 hypothetical protein COCVIDRAFT_33169 [Bipolaris victoriae FI3]EUC38447.1 hypothetical protein COCCADRAFT_82965 [Bipolaris zeicola 26-R-13]
MTMPNKSSLILRGATASETTPVDATPDQKTNAVPNQANSGAWNAASANSKHGCKLSADEHALPDRCQESLVGAMQSTCVTNNGLEPQVTQNQGLTRYSVE